MNSDPLSHQIFNGSRKLPETRKFFISTSRWLYLVDVLRESFLDFRLDEYKYKMKIVDFLKSKGVDYRSTPIPEYIKKRAQEEYPKTWQEHLEKY